jgi:hypothetical protein
LRLVGRLSQGRGANQACSQKQHQISAQLRMPARSRASRQLRSRTISMHGIPTFAISGVLSEELLPASGCQDGGPQVIRNLFAAIKSESYRGTRANASRKQRCQMASISRKKAP